MSGDTVDGQIHRVLVANEQWARSLEQDGHENFARIFRTCAGEVREAFNSQDRRRLLAALLSLRGAFSGGMGSVNDLAYGEQAAAARMTLKVQLDEVLAALG